MGTVEAAAGTAAVDGAVLEAIGEVPAAAATEPIAQGIKVS